MSRTPHGCSRTARALTRCLSHCPPPSLDDFLPWLLSHALPSQLLPLCLSLWTSRISSTTLPIPSPSNPAQCPSSILLCLQPCLPASSIPWPSRGLVPQPSLHGLLHGSRDVAAVLHQLEPVILHDPPRDGPLACPQAAVQDVVPAMHWRRNTPCRLRPAASLPASLEGEGAAGMLSHAAPAGHTGTSFITLTPRCREPFAPFQQKAKEMGNTKQAEGNPSA